MIGLAAVASLASSGWNSPANGAAVPLRERLASPQVVRLAPGANTVPGFAGDDRSALITLGWRDNGNAHGFDLYLVMLPSRPGGTDWNVVGVETDKGLEATITDAPHTGEDVVRSVRFARALLDGRPATLLFTATRRFNPSAGIPGPSKTDVQVYALRANTEGPGSTREYFESVGRFTTTTAYCNAEMALFQELGVPLPRSYSGPGTKTGC